jgi:hypothetical protein
MKASKFHLANISAEESKEAIDKATLILAQAHKDVIIGALLATADIVVNILTDGKSDDATTTATVFELAANQVLSCQHDEALMGGDQQWSFTNTQ